MPSSLHMLALVVAAIIKADAAAAFQHAAIVHSCGNPPLRWAHNSWRLSAQSDTDENADQAGTKEDKNLATKAAWYGVEVFGKVFGSNPKESTPQDYSGPPSSLQETMERVKRDFENSYFLGGNMDEELYDPDCEFADPFVSFRGRDRFVDNLQKGF